MAGEREDTGPDAQTRASQTDVDKGAQKALGEFGDFVAGAVEDVKTGVEGFLGVEESVDQRPRDLVTSRVSPDLPSFVELLNALPPTVERTMGTEGVELDRAGQLATLQAVATFLKTKADGGDQQAIADLANVQRVLTAAQPKPALEDPDLATRTRGTLEGEQLIDRSWQTDWTTPGRPDGNMTIARHNPGGLSGGVWGGQYTDLQVIGGIDTFPDDATGFKHLVENQSSHMYRTGTRNIIRGDGEHIVTGGVATAEDLLRVHAPEWKWVEVREEEAFDPQNPDLLQRPSWQRSFKRVHENDTDAYIESYKRTAIALGTWNDGAIPEEGDARLVMLLVIASKEGGYPVPQNPMDAIEGIGESTLAGAAAGVRGAHPDFPTWAENAPNRWHFERDGDGASGHMLIIRRDEEGNELGRVRMNADGAPEYTNEDGNGRIGVPPHPSDNEDFRDRRFTSDEMQSFAVEAA